MIPLILKYTTLKNSWGGGNEGIVDREELRQLAAEYELLLKTGNTVLDAVIAERSVICKEKNIKLLCNIDGNSICGMRQQDIYSMFSNILDNAIEAVEKLAETEKREIRLNISSHNDLVYIKCENYYDGVIAVNDNSLPQTTKDNKLYHGFGLRSIKQIVEKYDGGLKLRTENDMFYTNIVLCPTADSDKEKR